MVICSNPCHSSFDGRDYSFSNGASAANEYTYDNNGNLTKDSNKNISNIAYNVLNLPQQVTFSDGSTITYSYAADGTKLRTVHVINGTTTQKDYCANVVYENGVQKMLLTEEGYVDLSASTPTYYYYLKDHQGNNRVVINSSGTVAEMNHYYPFGGVFASTGNVQPYKYNGKELDTKKGLNWYDYGARHYDATLGRWFVADPLTEKYYSSSPFVYCGNNPINRIDPTGMKWKNVKEAECLKNRVTEKKQSLERKLAKQQSRLANKALNAKKAKKIEGQIAEYKARISHLETSLNDIELLRQDENNTYAFNHISGGRHQVRQGDDGIIYIDTSSDAMSIHEIAHVRQSLTNIGKLQFYKGYLTNAGRSSEEDFSKMEIEAYKIQYSYDLSFPGNLRGKGIQGIDVKSVGNIMNPDTGEYIYKVINEYSLKLEGK